MSSAPRTAPPPHTATLERSASATLSNGLRLFAAADDSVPAAAVNLWYRVGSRDEVAGRTGLAHLFEHLMFCGSAQVPSGDHAGLILDCGGTFNATTSFERTNYFETVPTGALRLALWLEADRMATLPDALSPTGLQAQRDVVRNERRQRFDDPPYGTAVEQLVAALFGDAHPYGHMAIGSMQDLAAASMDDAVAFFRRHYSPGNAVLSVVGDLPPQQAIDICAEYFDAIPTTAPVATAPAPAAEPDVGTTTIELVQDVPSDAVVLGFPAPPLGSATHDAAQLALSMLADRTGSALYQRLIRQDGIATSVSGGLVPIAYGPSIGMIQVEVSDGTDPAEVRDALLEEWARAVEDLQRREQWFARAVAMSERGWLERMSTLAGRADAYSEAITLFDDPHWATGHRQRMAAVTPHMVADAATALALDSRHVCLLYRRKDRRA